MLWETLFIHQLEAGRSCVVGVFSCHSDLEVVAASPDYYFFFTLFKCNMTTLI